MPDIRHEPDAYRVNGHCGTIATASWSRGWMRCCRGLTDQLIAKVGVDTSRRALDSTTVQSAIRGPHTVVWPCPDREIDARPQRSGVHHPATNTPTKMFSTAPVVCMMPVTNFETATAGEPTSKATTSRFKHQMGIGLR
ncbi:MAG: hypothetical protein R3B91_05985 [Planctomycetaceae bacterium]